MPFGWLAVQLIGFNLLSIAQEQTPLKLDIERNGLSHVRLSWPSSATGFLLEETSQLKTAPWLPVSQSPELVNEAFSLQIKLPEGNRFFRLRDMGSHLPPDPADVATEPRLGVVTLLGASTEFLYTGPNPIQTGVTNGTILAHRAAVVRGKVSQTGGGPLQGVTVSILNRPDYGTTLSRVDGMFDLAVNGGGPITVQYEKAGFLPVQRQAGVPSQEMVLLPDIVMLGVDPLVTTVAFGAGTAAQVHQGSVQSDADGTRRAILLFPPDTAARLVLPDGTMQDVNTLSIRATEYTVGTNGPGAMPAVLPPSSAYTYCAEFSADEALAAGATIEFDRPVITYVDNFLGFPVGGVVPAATRGLGAFLKWARDPGSGGDWRSGRCGHQRGRCRRYPGRDNGFGAATVGGALYRRADALAGAGDSLHPLGLQLAVCAAGGCDAAQPASPEDGGPDRRRPGRRMRFHH
jgi:hypothetical protein